MYQNRQGITALMLACKRGDLELINLFISHGCNMLTKDFSDRNAYWYLSTYDHPDLVDRFILCRSKDTVTKLRLGFPFELENDSRLSIVKETGVETNANSSSHKSNMQMHLGEVDKNEGNIDSEKIARWHTHQDILHKFPPKKYLLELERAKILKCRKKGRRHGITVLNEGEGYQKASVKLCQDCQVIRATKHCHECAILFCDRCYMHAHEHVDKRHHSFEEITWFPIPADAKYKEGMIGSINLCNESLNAIRTLLHAEKGNKCLDIEVSKRIQRENVMADKSHQEVTMNIPAQAAVRCEREGSISAMKYLNV